MQKKTNFWTVLLGFFLGFSPFSMAQLEVSPLIEWKTLRTDHFEIIFNAEQQELGTLYAEKLEKAYQDLRPFFITMPEKTVVVINDKTDITNGYAAPIPYPHIMAYPVLPGPEDSLADTGDWAYELLAHEYTHILTFAPAGGVVKTLRYVFGSIMAPNILLPRWWKEGLAVEMETRLGQHGRLRSIYQDAMIRAMVEDKTFFNFNIAQANEALPSWPQGMRPYLFGSLMWSQMLADKGESVIATLNERHGRRAPYFINVPAKDVFGTNYAGEYQRMMTETHQMVLAQIDHLKTQPPTTVFLPANRFNSVSAPAISPDNTKMALVTEDDANSRAVKLLSRTDLSKSFLEVKMIDTVDEFNEVPNTPLHRDGPPTGSIQRVSWFPDSTRIVYDKIDYSSRYTKFSDLYIYDIGKKKTRQLTHSLRAREPSVSPDGKTLVFVKLEGGRTHLALLKLGDDEKKDPTAEVLYSPAFQERISYPIFLDEKTLLFSLRKPSGEEFLYSYSIESQALQSVLSDFPNARFAKLTPKGLIFTSSRNGTHNLYVADEQLKSARPLTHTLTAIFGSTFDPVKEEIFVTTMTSEGPRVGMIAQTEWSRTSAELPKIEPLLADRYKKAETSSQTASATLPEVPAESLGELEDYSSLGYLLPRYWLPFIAGSSSETGVTIMAQTSGFDPLKKHSYTLQGSWDTGIGRGSFEALYVNQTTRLPVSLLGYQRSSYYGTIDNRVDDYGGALALSPSMFWLSPFANLQIGWKYMERSTVSSTVKRTGPFAMLSYANYSQSGAEVSPESGWGGYLEADHFIQGEDYLEHSQYKAGGLIYVSRFLPRHHAILLRLSGVYTPEKISSIYGVSTESLLFSIDSILPQTILRGYSRGQVFGRNLANFNFEYRFPLKRLDKGSGTTPIFYQNLVGSVVADGVAADGLYVNEIEGVYESVTMKENSFWSAGLEVKLETTLGYTFPFNFILGAYAAFNQPEGVQGVIGTRIQFSGF